VAIELRALERSDLPAARRVLRAACAAYSADTVAEEKLFGAAPAGDGSALVTVAYGAFDGDQLAGVAACSGDRIRLLAVAPRARNRGIGTVLLAALESVISGTGAASARTLDQPGNYLAPGIDAEDAETLGWLERRGYSRASKNHNLEIDVVTNPRVTPARARELTTAALEAGYELRRAERTDALLLRRQITEKFSPVCAFEVERALCYEPPGVHIALRRKDNDLAAFAVHDGNNQGLGWFGPGGTFEEHRRRGLGEGLLLACLLDVANAGLPICTVAWIGPREFYERAAGVKTDRFYVVMRKDLRSE
jgi:GNAT superfamily N-acetyltransferase